VPIPTLCMKVGMIVKHIVSGARERQAHILLGLGLSFVTSFLLNGTFAMGISSAKSVFHL
jgi:hypothetical protein